MEGILNTLEKKYLDFKLGEEQKNVLLSIFYFIKDNKETQCTLDGFGGSGKTTITKLIIHFLEDNDIVYELAAPTHKAKGVLSLHTDREATTLHKLLTLRPTIDIMELDYRDLQWKSNTLDNGIPRNGILIIDECSMVNEMLFDHIIKLCEQKNTKVIWIGDYAQICPVKEKKLSKAFSINNVFRLTKVYRQKGDNPLLDVLYELRSTPKKQFDTIISNNGSLIKHHQWKEFIDDNVTLFSNMIINRDPNHVKLIAYTNNRVEAFNDEIRKRLFKNNNEYNIGDMLMGYDSCEYKIGKYTSHEIKNSNDYYITEVEPHTKYIGYSSYYGYNITIYSFEEQCSFTVFIVSKNNTQSSFDNLANLVESVRMKAINCREKQQQKKYWVEYFNIMGSFLTPYDLCIDGRTVRKKSIDYGYCITSHKSQGSSYEHVLIDMGNIFRCTNPLELRQLQYVAMSRTRKDIHMLIK